MELLVGCEGFGAPSAAPEAQRAAQRIAERAQRCRSQPGRALVASVLRNEQRLSHEPPLRPGAEAPEEPDGQEPARPAGVMIKSRTRAAALAGVAGETIGEAPCKRRGYAENAPLGVAGQPQGDDAATRRC